MKFPRARSLAAGMLMLAYAGAVPAQAAAPALVAPAAQAEIGYLLSTVAGSGCEFYRNGSWHDPRSAADHLAAKYRYLAARNQVRSAEDFVEKAATRSSVSGHAYAIRCAGAAPVPTRQWLLILLARYRESHPDALSRN